MTRTGKLTTGSTVTTASVETSGWSRLGVAQGEHGSELVVEFGLVLSSDPDLKGIPQRGTHRVPFDAEWRELSGYAEPAAYAPVVAGEVEMAARDHVERNRRREPEPLEGDQARPAPPAREAQWQIFLDALGDQGAVREVAPGRVELHDSGGTAVTVVVSPDQWDRVLAGPAGDDVGLYFAELLGPRQEDETFLVFYNGALARSTREKLPPVRGRAVERMMADARADDADAQFGWYAHPAE